MAGVYTIEVTNDDTNCSATAQFTVGDNTTIPGTPAFTVTDVEDCSGAATYPNGSITIDDVGGDATGNYTYAWYIGNSSSGTQITNGMDLLDVKTASAESSGANTVTGATSATIDNLDAGSYTVIATHNTTGCASAETTIDIVDDPATIQIAGVETGNSNCTGFNGAVDITVTMSDASTPSGYTYAWYSGAGTSNALGITTEDIGSLEDGVLHGRSYQ